MQTLERNYIAIDTWAVLYPAETTFLLTHVHTDHANIPKGFRHLIYASTQTESLFDHRAVRPILLPEHWYDTHHPNIPFKVVKTFHTIDSIGFLFPTLAVLFIGDGLVPSWPMVHRPLTIIYDGLYEHVHLPSPTVTQTCQQIQAALQQTPVLQLVHHGILSFLESCRTKFRMHHTLSPLVRKTAELLQLVDHESPYVLVGRTYTLTPRVVPSSYWFTRQHPPVDLFVTHVDGDLRRVFCSLHALGSDTRRWKAALPSVHFEVLPTAHV